MNFRQNIVLVLDTHTMQYAALRAAIRQISGIQSNETESKIQNRVKRDLLESSYIKIQLKSGTYFFHKTTSLGTAYVLFNIALRREDTKIY